MPAAVTSPLDPGESTWKIGLLFSILFHLALIIVIPVCMAMAKNTVRFERPSTFQLVTAPSSLKALTPQRQRKLTKQVRQTVKKESSRPIPGNKRVSKEENIDELASLLDELPAPTRVSVVGEFKYNWYLANVQQKISRYWNPSNENRNLSVEVLFTIHRDGSITEPRLGKPSGNGTLDNMALRAVNSAAPFGKMPAGFAGNNIELMVTLIPTLN
jgi:TonB family protein